MEGLDKFIDDIGAETTTSWGRDEVLGTILQYRMQEGLVTFFTSNFTMDELEEHFSVSKGSNDSVNNLEEPPVKPGSITTEQIDSMPTANDPFANVGNEVQINDSDLPF